MAHHVGIGQSVVLDDRDEVSGEVDVNPDTGQAQRQDTAGEGEVVAQRLVAVCRKNTRRNNTRS